MDNNQSNFSLNQGLTSNQVSSWQSQRLAQGLWRELGEISFDPSRDLSSNDYLGLSHDREFRRILEGVSSELPMGSRGSRLLGGNHPEHLELEEDFCAWKQAPAALCFPSGFQANISVFQTIAKLFEGALVFSDARNHASMIDGMRLARLETQVYRHLDLDDLDVRLQQARRLSPARTLIVATEAVFSMTGLAVSLSIQDVAEKHGAWLVVDEAHSIGLLGHQGQGLFQHAPNLILTHPCGKALAAAGAVVTGPVGFIDALRQEGRGFIYSTGLSPWLAKGIRLAATWIKKHDEERNQFLDEIEKRFGLKHPIFGLEMASNEKAQQGSMYLRDLGWMVYPIRYPTVPRGAESIRLSLNPLVDLASLEHDLKAMATFLKVRSL